MAVPSRSAALRLAYPKRMMLTIAQVDMVAWTAPTTGGNASHGWDGPHYILYDGNRPTVRPTDPETKRWANITMFEGSCHAHLRLTTQRSSLGLRATSSNFQEHSLGELL